MDTAITQTLDTQSHWNTKRNRPVPRCACQLHDTKSAFTVSPSAPAETTCYRSITAAQKWKTSDVQQCILIYLCILIGKHALFCIFFANWHSSDTLTEVCPCFFLSCKAYARVYLAKTGHGPHPSYLMNCVVLCIVCVLMCTVLLPSGVNPIAVKYIIYLRWITNY